MENIYHIDLSQSEIQAINNVLLQAIHETDVKRTEPAKNKLRQIKTKLNAVAAAEEDYNLTSLLRAFE